MTFRDWADEKGNTLANQDDECEVRAEWAKFYVKNPQAGSVLVYESAFAKFGRQQLDSMLDEQWHKADLQWVQITDKGVTETHKEAPNRPGKGSATKH
ncbi:MAG: hypothetical protein ACTIKR_14590 [Advenella sp.]|uniref:Uncharacterized protein n=1 Tax=Advenella kashmirensis TaxID=310575 RepID=A0A356LGA2_9BURK|nr:hypothetical protein [Advenella sp. FME57]HBP29601.1 hypothetical protein [Advenella kashmirensis]